ncbi:MAG: cation:proton antiporter [Chloroflexi bacterium]|nr:cation:proton antiporter [Chloroflexota bacterium]
MEGENITELVTHLAFQLAAILMAAKIGGEICQRWLKIPPVIGELLAGVAIGPFALGQFTITSGFGALFALPHGFGEVGGGVIPVSNELWAIGQIGAIVLLFMAGLETNAKLFFRYAGPGAVVAIGGIVFPFLFGVYATILFDFADGFSDPRALFMGAIMSATSVGITARVLSERRKLDTPEGVTILAGAVIDDVLSILILSIVVGIADTGSISTGEILGIAAKAIGFWISLMAIGFLLSRQISRFFLSFRTTGAALGLSFALALLVSGLAEEFGLAMIIGAYSIGLALSGTRLAHQIEEQLGHLANALVPIFFVVMGMLVDVGSMTSAIGLGVVITLLAIVGKVVGAGAPALTVGFNLRGASRIGVGMLPRGEVALIIAGVGLAAGVIEQDLFGVAILMTIITTVIAPIILIPLFDKGGSGLRRPPTDGPVASGEPAAAPAEEPVEGG